MIESNSRSGTIRSLQHLRVVAASLIILYHSELQISRLTSGVHEHSLGFGAAGTDLFFVIGGFILVYTSSGRRDTLGTFLYRRVMRIAPLYWVFTILMLAVLLVAPGNLMTTKFDPGHFLASLAFVPYPHPVLAIERPFLFPGWVLNYFVFFYLLFGSLLALSVARRIVAIGLVLCTLALLQSRFPGASHLLDFYGAPIVLDFVMGMIVAWLYLERRIPSGAIAIVFLAGLAVFAAGVLKHVSGGDDRALYWGTADAAFLLVCVFIEKQWGWPNWGFLSSLGDASYSVFVSHLFTLALVTSIVRALGMFPTLGTIGVRILFVVAAWAVGMLIYVTIERPLTRRLIPHPAARSLAAVAAKSS
jgi:exopolysaccharide production protein ExoZ